MTKLRSWRMAVCKIISGALVVALQACANPMPCPGEPGAPMDQWGNEVDIGAGGNHEQHLNTDCYYGRGDNGKIVLLTQKPQTGFWNSAIFRTDETTPLNTRNIETVQNEPLPEGAHDSVENSAPPTQLENRVSSGAAPAPSAAPLFNSPPAPVPQPANQALYYRAGKVKGACGTMNVYREADAPPCPEPVPPSPPPVQRTYIQNNYPPVSVQTGEPPAQAAGAFLGGIGEDVMGAGVLTYAIRYRPDNITSNSYSGPALSHARELPPPHGFHGHPGDPGRFHHPEPRRPDPHRPDPHGLDTQHHPDPGGGRDDLIGLLDK